MNHRKRIAQRFVTRLIVSLSFCLSSKCKLLHQYKCKSCGSNQCTCKRPFKKTVDQASRSQSGTPDLIELSSDSDMDISEDERGFDKNLDFIPLVSDLDEVQDAEEVDRKPAIESDESYDQYRSASAYDYESDDSWFEDEKNVNSLSTKYIPLFLLN